MRIAAKSQWVTAFLLWIEASPRRFLAPQVGRSLLGNGEPSPANHMASQDGACGDGWVNRPIVGDGRQRTAVTLDRSSVRMPRSTSPEVALRRRSGAGNHGRSIAR
jgi:hypothetical protein